MFFFLTFSFHFSYLYKVLVRLWSGYSSLCLPVQDLCLLIGFPLLSRTPGEVSLFVLLRRCNYSPAQYVSSNSTSRRFNFLTRASKQPLSLYSSSLLHSSLSSAWGRGPCRSTVRTVETRRRRRARAPSMERRTIVGRFSRILTAAGSYGDGLFHFILVPPPLPKRAIISSADTGNPIWRLEIKRCGVKLSLRCQTPSVAAARRRYGFRRNRKQIWKLHRNIWQTCCFTDLFRKARSLGLNSDFVATVVWITLKSNQTTNYLLKK